MATASDSFLSADFEDIESMWTVFKTAISGAVDQRVPSKLTTTRSTHSLVNTGIRRLMRQKQSAKWKAKKSGNQQDWERFKRLQAEVQKST